MFLQKLDQKRREAFLQICFYAIKSNGVIEKEEMNALNDYAKEMGVSMVEEKELDSFEDVLMNLSEGTNEECKIVLFELIALLKIDGVFDLEELSFINQVADALGFSKTDVKNFSLVLDEYLEAFNKVCKCVII